jgi:RND family efflux transporter MFP subunit
MVMETLAAVWMALLAFFGFGTAPPPPVPPPSYLVRSVDLAEEKSVFATVESVNTVPARARIGGTVVALQVKQGDWVFQGQIVAVVGDPKLALQAGSYQAQVAAAQAELKQAEREYARAKQLIAANAIARNSFDQARTAYDVARSNVGSLTAQKAMVLQQSREGQILAPASGRVIAVPVTAGTVVVGGDTVATVAEQNFVLRLKVPETHAHYLKSGACVRLDGADIGLAGVRSGTIRLIYPDIEAGHVVADADVPGLTDYFVGERVRVLVPVGSRRAIVVPAKLVVTRAGIDYVRLLTKSGGLDVPVQRGQTLGGGANVEILSGLHSGDRLLKP